MVIRGYQRMEFEEEFIVLDGRRNKKLKESIGCLDPYVGKDGRVEDCSNQISMRKLCIQSCYPRKESYQKW